MGTSRVVLDGGDITFTCPGTFTVQAATHDWGGGSSAAAQLNPLPSGVVAPIEAASWPLQPVYARMVSFEEVPREWLPRAIARRVHGVHQNETLIGLDVSQDDVLSEPLMLNQPVQMQLWLWSSAAWQIDEAVAQPPQDCLMDDEDRSEEDAAA